jgi:hypothetical protein
MPAGHGWSPLSGAIVIKGCDPEVQNDRRTGVSESAGFDSFSVDTLETMLHRLGET